MNYIDILKKGSGIHIKKANRGKFTDYCGGKVTSECISKGKHSSDPAVRKRATFAANARKWKHQSGGVAKYGKGFYSSEDVQEPEEQNTFRADILSRTNNIITSKEKEEEKEDTGWDDLFSESEITPAHTEEHAAEVTTKKDISDDLKTLLGMFSKAGIKVRMTSGYREGATTKQGNPSHHATGHAMDIVPENGDFKALALAIKTNPEISAFMKSKGLGILDETSAEMLAKTGGSGAHFHVGPDKIAQNFWLA